MVRLLRASVALAVAAMLMGTAPMAANAQAGGGQGAGTTTDTRATQDTQPRNEDDGFDPGWFGLLGLAGLFGLRRPREEHTTTTTRLDATPVTRKP